MNRTYEEWLKYYENATKEQVIEDIMLDIKEIQRLNNIIEELKKWIKEDKKYAMENFECGRCFNMFDILDKLKELKGGE